jgi:hypothetical protein
MSDDEEFPGPRLAPRAFGADGAPLALRPGAPHPNRIATALAAVSNPAAHGAHPALLAAAWADLKAARGQTVDLDRLQPAYLIDRVEPLTGIDATLPAPPFITDLMRARISGKVQRRAAILAGLPVKGGAA